MKYCAAAAQREGRLSEEPGDYAWTYVVASHDITKTAFYTCDFFFLCDPDVFLYICIVSPK